MARIALDAMGGDHAPQAPVAGAIEALAELDSAHSIQLIGRRATVERELAGVASDGQRKRIEIVDAPDVVEMTDKPTDVRKKPNSSMMVGLKLQADGKSDAFVSAGNTGAQMAASMLLLRLHAGLKRPAIATIFPTARRPVVVLDSGANVDCSAEELVQFARLGSVYAEDILGRSKPAVGLLSIGEEPEKGNTVTKEAHALLAESEGLNFLGNCEGRDLPAGTCHHGDLDVVVCDGFVGNVILKFYEAVAPLMVRMLVKEGLQEQTIRKALRQIDYSEHGGAPLLGVKGVSIICHGRSSPAAIKNAIKVAVRAVDSRMNDHIGRRLEHSASGSAGSAGAAGVGKA